MYGSCVVCSGVSSTFGTTDMKSFRGGDGALLLRLAHPL